MPRTGGCRSLAVTEPWGSGPPNLAVPGQQRSVRRCCPLRFGRTQASPQAAPAERDSQRPPWSQCSCETPTFLPGAAAPARMCSRLRFRRNSRSRSDRTSARQLRALWTLRRARRRALGRAESDLRQRSGVAPASMLWLRSRRTTVGPGESFGCHEAPRPLRRARALAGVLLLPLPWAARSLRPHGPTNGMRWSSLPSDAIGWAVPVAASDARSLRRAGMVSRQGPVAGFGKSANHRTHTACGDRVGRSSQKGRLPSAAVGSRRSLDEAAEQVASMNPRRRGSESRRLGPGRRRP